MELKEYLVIFKRHANLFLGVLLVFLLLGMAVKMLQPVRFQAELVLNVTRLGEIETTDYRFDSFYRLQADERFADTVVRWLETARMQKDIQSISGADKLISLTAKRLSSQMISIKFKAENARAAEKIAEAISQVINLESTKLNEQQKEKNWFVVMADEPVVSSTAWPWDRVIFISLVLGIFFAFWSVIIAHYVREE